jgi:hypothetical protein
LSTATSIDDGKRMKALQSWAEILRDKYGIDPRFIHTDKDMAEIGMSRRVWTKSKHQLCWWHQREALKRRLKGNLPTSIYNSQRAKDEYSFIDPSFKPYGQANTNDEGIVPGEECEPEAQGSKTNALTLTGGDPYAIKIRIPPILSNPVDDLKTAALPQETLKIRIPARLAVSGDNLDKVDEESTNERRTFCPIEQHTAVIDMMERHFCAHPLIPGYSAPTPESIKAWAVKQMYGFCVLHNLPNLWAYLWENWYRRGRWELWARSSHPDEIPRLKTTMIVEAQLVNFVRMPENSNSHPT